MSSVIIRHHPSSFLAVMVIWHLSGKFDVPVYSSPICVHCEPHICARRGLNCLHRLVVKHITQHGQSVANDLYVFDGASTSSLDQAYCVMRSPVRFRVQVYQRYSSLHSRPPRCILHSASSVGELSHLAWMIHLLKLGLRSSSHRLGFKSQQQSPYD